MTFHPNTIWLLGLLCVVPVWYYCVSRRSRHAACLYSNLHNFKDVPVGWIAIVHRLPVVLRTVALSLLAFSAARPILFDRQSQVHVDGIAIQLVVDRSSSMLAMDFKLDQKPTDRLSVVKRVARSFILGGDGFEGRPNDMLGLTSFAGFADTLSPPTLDHSFLTDGLEQLVVARRGTVEDGTAIGDALALAVETLRDLGANADPAGHHRIRSKVIILLTDGENTAGDLDPIKAAELAASMGIRVYTIGTGTRGMAPMPVEFRGRTRLETVPVTIDEETLITIADITGGQYFRATETDTLKEIHKQIDLLEKSRTEERQYLSVYDLAVHPIDIDHLRLPPLVLIAILILLTEVALSWTRFQRLP